MGLGVIFPGQGSQSIGMLQALAEDEPLVEQTFAEASNVLGYDLWDLCQNGPESRLNETEQTQPAMLSAGIAVWRIWCAHGGVVPGMVAGHSLGEYSALVASGVLDFSSAVRLVQLRGQLMQQAVPAGQGAIAAVLGLDDDKVIEVCAEICKSASPKHVAAVNFNAPGQVVIAGHKPAVELALERLRESGARRAVTLPMSVPVHCELMRPATEQLTQHLHAAQLHPGAFPVLQNADLKVHESTDDIVIALAAQLYTPVRWADSIQKITAQSGSVLVECGPGKVLTGLCRRIDRTITCHSVYDSLSLKTALEATQELA